ncbi:unnamed protein product [Brassica oleracea]
MEGCQVEITYTNNRFKKVWYSATIELEPQTKPRSRFQQRCVRVLKDDSLNPFTVFTHKASFHPIPTNRYEDRVEIKEGSIVDADHNDEWWVGLVLKQVGDDKFLTWWVLPGRNVQVKN